MTMEMRWHTRTVTSTAILALAMAGVVVTSAKADDTVSSFPPDTTSYSRPLVSEDLTLGSTAGTTGLAGRVSFSVVDTVVNNTNPLLRFTDDRGDQETSIAVNPQHPNEIVITAFSGTPAPGGWPAPAPLWLSRNGGNTWTKEFTINPPPGVPGVPGCHVIRRWISAPSSTVWRARSSPVTATYTAPSPVTRRSPPSR